jgi:hypothetical protein
VVDAGLGSVGAAGAVVDEAAGDVDGGDVVERDREGVAVGDRGAGIPVAGRPAVGPGPWCGRR